MGIPWVWKSSILLWKLSRNHRLPNFWETQPCGAPKIYKNLMEVYKLPKFGITFPFQSHGIHSVRDRATDLRLATSRCLHLLHEVADGGRKSWRVYPEIVAGAPWRYHSCILWGWYSVYKTHLFWLYFWWTIKGPLEAYIDICANTN